jgi:phospholipid/cholesterol/gamma-HCH transport system substrate-binding protein
METKANYVAVGIFTSSSPCWRRSASYTGQPARRRHRGETAVLRVRIPGSASGLGSGSAVLFNGVKVGDVTRVYIDVRTIRPRRSLKRSSTALTPITESTSADIGIAGLTGQANIELKGGTVGGKSILDAAAEAGEIAEITANPSALGNILQLTQNFLTRADGVLSSVETFVDEVRVPLTGTVTSAQKFADALGNNADAIDEFLASVGDLSKTFSSVSGKLDSTLASVEKLLDAVDEKKIDTIVSNVTAVTNNLKGASDNIETVVSNVDEAVKSISSLSQSANGTIAKVDKILDGVDASSINATMENIKVASETARRGGVGC